MSPRFLFYILLIFAGDCFSQQNKIDSLFPLLKTAENDSSRFVILMALGKNFQVIAPDSAMSFHNSAKALAEKQNDLLGVADALVQLGWDYYAVGNADKPPVYYSKALAITEKYAGKKYSTSEISRAKKIIASARSSIGVFHYVQGDYPAALESYFTALKISEEIGRKDNQAINLSNIGIVYMDQGDQDKALSYYLRALQMAKEIGNKKMQAINLGNIGNIYTEKGDYAKALDYYLTALKLNEETMQKHAQAAVLGNISVVYLKKGDYKICSQYCQNAIRLFEEFGDKKGIVTNLCNLAACSIKLKNYKDAEQKLHRSLLLAGEANVPDEIKEIHFLFSELYEATNRPLEALEHYKLFIQYRDNIRNDENTRKSIQQEYKFNYEKKHVADSVGFARQNEVTTAEIRKQRSELSAKRNQQYALFGGLLLVVLFTVFTYNRFQVTKRQKSIIEKQKQLVETKQQEVLDSIRYARRIQNSLLTAERYIQTNINRLANLRK